MNTKVEAIRVLVADRQPDIRRRLCRLIESAGGIHVVAEAEAALPALELARQLKPDVLLLDYGLLRDCEPERIRETELPGCQPRTIATVSSIERAEVLSALVSGARGIVLKTVGPQQLRQSIRCVMAGRYWLGARAVSILVDTIRESAGRTRDPRCCDLTARELDVVNMVARGRSNREVSQELCISERTVKHHLTTIFAKVGVTSRLELALFAVNHLEQTALAVPTVASTSVPTDELTCTGRFSESR